MLDADGGALPLTRRERRELVGVALLTIVVWLAWAAIFFVVVPSWAFHAVSFDLGALAAFATTAAAWIVLLARHRMPLQRRLLVLVVGWAASAVWLPVLWFCAALIPFAMSAFIFFAVPLALIPLLLWGGFLASWSLSKWAFQLRARATP